MSSFAHHRALAAAALILALGACGGGDDPQPPPPPPPPRQVTVSSIQGPTQARLACYRGTATAACDLRLYEVMVEAFIDADPAANFGVGYGSSHHRGDLAGVTASLDYIKSLGVNALWLTPIFLSTNGAPTQLDATGYFARDYFSVDPHLGTLAQARTLVEEAHARGLYVFFDGVFGHHKNTTVTPSPGGNLPTGSDNPVSYPGSLDFYKEVATYWVKELKIDGWRLDQANQVPAQYWDDLRSAVAQASQDVTYVDAHGQTVHPLGYMVAEVWSGEGDIASAAYGSTAAPALESSFDFPLRYRLVQVLATQERTEQSWAMNGPASRLQEGFANYALYPDHAMPNLMLTNHDLVRFGDLIQRAGYPGPSDESYWSRHRAAFDFMAATSGPITLYYGDEIGQELSGFAQRVTSDCAVRGVCDDHVSRTSGIVEGLRTTTDGGIAVLNAHQSALKAHVTSLMALRAAHPALSSGTQTHVYSDETVYLALKTAGPDRVLFALNTGRSTATLTLDASVVAGAGSLTDLLGEDALDATGGQFTIEVPALSGRFLGY